MLDYVIRIEDYENKENKLTSLPQGSIFWENLFEMNGLESK